MNTNNKLEILERRALELEAEITGWEARLDGIKNNHHKLVAHNDKVNALKQSFEALFDTAKEDFNIDMGNLRRDITRRLNANIKRDDDQARQAEYNLQKARQELDNIEQAIKDEVNLWNRLQNKYKSYTTQEEDK